MTTFDEDADDAMRLVNGPAFPDRDERDAMVAELDRILADCVLYCAGEGEAVYVDAAMDYLDRLAATPGLLHHLLVDLRIGYAVVDEAERDRRIAAELDTVVQAEQTRWTRPVGRAAVPLPMTCASPGAHTREARRRMPMWWLRLAGLLDGPSPDNPAICPVCGLPWPRSHRAKETR